MKYYLVFLVSCSCSMLACSMSATSGLPREAATVTVAATPTVPAQVQGVSREVCAESLWVRVEPMGERRGFVSRGETIQVFEPVNGWSQVAAGKWRGLWVRESWLCE